jgi:SAM-dependent methyltransferase
MTSPVKVRTTCRLCGSSELELTVPLASVPIISPNVGHGEKDSAQSVVAPLDNYLCNNCGLIQLIHVVDPALIYRNYLYRTSISLGLSDHFRGLAEAVIDRQNIAPSDLIVEIGSNDGTLLSFFDEHGAIVQGVDPAEGIAEEATARGIPTRADFFTDSLAKQIVVKRGKARAVLCNNAMANIDELGEVLSGVRTLLAPDGAFVFETQYAYDVFEKTLIDVIYHEHISCFSVLPVTIGLKEFGLEVFDVERIPTKGGSIRFWVKLTDGPQNVSPRVAELISMEKASGLYSRDRHKQFADKVAEIKAGLHKAIAETQQAGGSIAAFGTSVGCAALIHQFELEDKLDYLLDDTPFKTSLSGPGYDLPVYLGAETVNKMPGLILILAWRYADKIVERQTSYLAKGGKFIVPLPNVEMISQ